MYAPEKCQNCLNRTICFCFSLYFFFYFFKNKIHIFLNHFQNYDCSERNTKIRLKKKQNRIRNNMNFKRLTVIHINISSTRTRHTWIRFDWMPSGISYYHTDTQSEWEEIGLRQRESDGVAKSPIPFRDL